MRKSRTTKKTGNIRWVRKPKVWHWRAKKYIFRKDGRDFLFPVFC